MSLTLDSIRLANSTVIDLHEATTPRELAPVLFKFIAEVLPQSVLFLILRPLEFELRSFVSRPEFQGICDSYIAGDHRDDIWLKRSPQEPDTPVVRHSLYTPKELFHRSRFYHQVMEKIGCEYGASLVAWRRENWLGNLTIFRTKAQGDFQEDELPALNLCHRHFESAIKRIATFHEEKLGSQSLAALIWNLPTAAIVLDWNLKVRYGNALSQELIAEWKKGSRLAAIKQSRRYSIPGEVVAAIEEGKPLLAEMKSNRPKSPNVIPLSQVQHPHLTELTANVSFVPAKSLAVSKGAFLVVFHRREDIPGNRDSYDRLVDLTRRERDVVLLAASGKNSGQIGKKLGTSALTVRKQLHNAYKKLGISSRLELMALFARNPLIDVDPAPADLCIAD